LRTTWCGIIVVAEIGEKAAEPRSGSVIFENVATFDLQSPRALTKCAHIFARSFSENLRRDRVSRDIVYADHVGHANLRHKASDEHFIQKRWLSDKLNAVKLRQQPSLRNRRTIPLNRGTLGHDVVLLVCPATNLQPSNPELAGRTQ
jgi:hypothetical protein